MADTQAHLDKAIEIAQKVQERINKIRSGVESFQKGMLETIQKAEDAVTNAAGRSQKAVDKELRKLQEKFDNYHKTAQEWIDEQLKQTQKWMDEQMAKIQKDAKYAKARVEASIIECSTDVELTTDQVKAIADAMPDIPIPKPTIPKIQLPKLEFPFQMLNLEDITNQAMAASGASDIMSVGKNIAQTKLI